MTKWANRVLKEFPADLARFWIVADPDDVLLDERLLSALRERGFSVLPFEDSVAFRAEYEERYRAAWDRGEPGPSPALILHLCGTEVSGIPWDYRRQARLASLSLSHLFPKLSSSVVRQLDGEMLPLLYEAQEKHAHHPLGEAATKDFVLTHIFRMSPHFITRHEDLWRELLRLHYREWTLPPVLAQYVGQIVGDNEAFQKVPVAELFADRSLTLRMVREAWYLYLTKQGVAGSRIAEPPPSEYVREIEIPFEHPDVRGIIDSMFLDGTLPPVTLDQVPASLPKWASNGVVEDPASRRNLVLAGIEALSRELPTLESLHRDWIHFAQRLAEVLARFQRLDIADSTAIAKEMAELRRKTDRRLVDWVERHYTNLPSLPIGKGPVIVHHVPHFLALRRGGGEEKIALLVLDGMAIDQWIQVREHVAKHSRRLAFEENACFAWLPTLTSVSRQALFSGLRPREFADSIDTTAKDSGLWQRFWQGQGLRSNEIFFRKSLKHNDLADLESQLSGSPVKVAGFVVDTIDNFVHGSELGKREITSRIATWCELRVLDRLFELLLTRGFHVYLTSDHGNVEAVGIGRPNQGVAPEVRAERVRIYRSENLISESATSIEQTFRLQIPGLPPDFKPLFASGYGAFIPKGEQLVAHGGVSTEELLVPFIKVKYSSKMQ